MPVPHLGAVVLISAEVQKCYNLEQINDAPRQNHFFFFDVTTIIHRSVIHL